MFGIASQAGKGRVVRGALSMLFALVLALPVWAQRHGPGPARSTTAAKATARSAPRSEPSGFTIGPAPAWVETVPADAAGTEAAPLQLLLADRQLRLEPTGTVRYLHFIRQVNDASGVQKGAQIEVEFDPSYQKLVLHQLVLWRGAQRIDKLDAGQVKLLHRETQLERQVLDGRMTASIVLDDLRAGDRVEWALSLVGDNPVFAGRFADVEWLGSVNGPTGLWRVRLLAPAGRAIRHHSLDPAVQVQSRERGAWHDTLFIRRAVPQAHYDEWLPPSAWLQDQLELSEFSGWNDVAAWAQPLFAQAMQGSPALDERAAAIRAQAAAPMERLRRALDFVQQEVRYFGTEIGPYSHRPTPADTVLRQRFGDCKDKAALLATLLGGLGIEATPVLVSTQYRDEVQGRLPSPLAFDHAIVRASVDGQTLWLDGTRTLQTGTPDTRQSLGLGWGLPARADAADLIALPGTAEQVYAETVDTFSFPSLAREGTLESVTTYYGELAESVRESQAAMPAADFEKAATEDSLRAYPGLVRDGPVLTEPLAERNALKVTARYRTGEFWRFPEQRVLVADYALLRLMGPLRLPDQVPRTQPLRLGPAGRYLHTLKFQFGETVIERPSSTRFDESNKHFELHVRYEGERDTQVIAGELRQTGAVIEPADWPHYRELLEKVWPKLGSVVALPAVTPAQAEVLRGELTDLDRQVRSGRLNLSTRVQVGAQVRVLVLEKQLASGRLPDKLRAQALVAKGVQLDFLGRVDPAADAFNEAMALDASNAEAPAGLAVNALLRRQDAQAVDLATRALQMAPADTSLHYTRAWARFFAGDTAQARDELLGLLQSRSEVERSYAAIWLYLATRRLGGDGVAAVRPYAPQAEHPAWPHAVLRLMTGELDLDAALAMAREGGPVDSGGRECELYFYAGEKALADDDTAKARAFFKKSLATGVVEFNEHAMARRELDRIDGR